MNIFGGQRAQRDQSGRRIPVPQNQDGRHWNPPREKNQVLPQSKSLNVALAPPDCQSAVVEKYLLVNPNDFTMNPESQRAILKTNEGEFVVTLRFG